MNNHEPLWEPPSEIDPNVTDEKAWEVTLKHIEKQSADLRQHIFNEYLELSKHSMELVLNSNQEKLEDYEQTWVDYWQDICSDECGLLLDQIKRELHDYKTLLKNVPLVYDEITGGRISKPNTDPVHVIQAVNDRIDEAYDEGYADAMNDAPVVECHD